MADVNQYSVSFKCKKDDTHAKEYGYRKNRLQRLKHLDNCFPFKKTALKHLRHMQLSVSNQHVIVFAVIFSFKGEYFNFMKNSVPSPPILDSVTMYINKRL